MDKFKVISRTAGIVMIIFLILGLLQRRHYEQLRQNDQAFYQYDRTLERLHVLDQIQSGDTNNIVDYLEQHLYIDLVWFWVYDKQDPKAQSGLANLMSEVSSYRAKYPNSYAPGTMLWNGKTLNASQAVAEVLSWTNRTVRN